ncbi:DUF4355 domain-containing protein [Bacillus infantis]|uniref:DUF4355 domain-containing protein n=1 Tax=Bacillus infantis TaxID=324767 RepID=UPI0013EA8C4B|nr:DUF4355 domain-containing protein [Bacillus infantis]
MFIKDQSNTKFLPLDIQFFSDENPEGGTEDNQDNQPATISLTEDELNLKLQQESDRRVQQALKKWEEKKALELETVKKEAQEEATKLAKMSEEERRKVEEEKEQMKRDEERRAFEKEKLEFQREKLFVQTEKELVNENLPSSFASFLIAEDAEKTNVNIQAFKAAFNEAVKVQANAALGGKPPVAGNVPNTGGLTQEKFDGMSYSEKVSLRQDNPELYKKFITN